MPFPAPMMIAVCSEKDDWMSLWDWDGVTPIIAHGYATAEELGGTAPEPVPFDIWERLAAE